jgi:CheY-like chemotaxis protein
MPGMDGFRMLKTIRNTVELAHTAIVVVTGLSAEEIKTGGMMPDDIPVLPKPIPFERLKEIAMQLVPNTSTEGAIA